MKIEFPWQNFEKNKNSNIKFDKKKSSIGSLVVPWVRTDRRTDEQTLRG